MDNVVAFPTASIQVLTQAHNAPYELIRQWIEALWDRRQAKEMTLEAIRSDANIDIVMAAELDEEKHEHEMNRLEAVIEAALV